MISTIALFAALMALSPFASAQDAGTTSVEAAATVLPASGLPNCVPLCLQTKFGEADRLAPACSVNDLFCLCTTSPFVLAFRQCLFDNCANTQESMQGRQTWAEICADSGASLLSYSAKNDNQAAATAVAEVASVLAIPVSGSALIPTASFDQGSALAYVESNYAVQTQQAFSTAVAGMSLAAASASASIEQEAEALSASLDQAEQQASAMEDALQTQLSGSDLAAAQSQIAATLSMMRVAASQKLEGDIAAVQASLDAQSNSLHNPTPTASASVDPNVKAVSSSAFKTCQYSMFTLLAILLAIVGVL